MTAMTWDKKAVGKMILDARLKMGCRLKMLGDWQVSSRA